MNLIENTVIQLFIEYFLPVVATNIIVDYAKVFIDKEKHKKQLPIICITVSIITGVIFSIGARMDNQSFLMQVFYTFTLANLVYNIGLYGTVKEFLLRKFSKRGDCGRKQ